MADPRLKEAFARAEAAGGVVMVHGPSINPTRLQEALETVRGKNTVRTLDCTKAAVPNLADLDSVFAEGLKPGRVLQVAVDRQVPDALWDALVSVASTNQLPSGAKLPDNRGVLVFSARVKFLSELNHKVQEYFPVAVADFE
jgi:hypothetical protein